MECPTCDGKRGFDTADGPEACIDCNGTGKVQCESCLDASSDVIVDGFHHLCYDCFVENQDNP